MNSGFTALAGVVLVAFGASWIGFLLLRSRLRSSRGAVFRLLGLKRADRRLLLRLARTLGTSDPLPLLIGRGCFERAVCAAELDELEFEHLALTFLVGGTCTSDSSVHAALLTADLSST